MRLAALVTFFVFTITCIILTAIFFREIRRRSLICQVNDVQHFIVQAPMMIVGLGIISVFGFGVFSAVMFGVLDGGLIGTIVALIILGISGYFTYMVTYHMLYETHINGDELTHRELFHARYTIAFNEVKRAERKIRMGTEFLTLYSQDEVLLVAESLYAGYDLLLIRLEQVGIEVEEK